jgi:hypothetical protein
VVQVYNPSYVGGIGRRIAVQIWTQTKMPDPYPKNNNNNQSIKLARGVAQMVQHLPSKCRALSSNTIAYKKKILNKWCWQNWICISKE